MKVLVTGGCGYIGSHTVVELLENNYEVIIVDNLINSKIETLSKIEKITGKTPKFYQIDLCDKEKVREVFSENEIDAVIHFAGLKAVGESVKKPILYYENNLISTLNLLEVMKESNCKKIVFSSSATVYGDPNKLPIQESFPLSTTNPYGSTKLFIEYMLKDLYKSDPSWGIAILRYFNPIGSHSSYLLGEDPNGIPNNLMPYIVKVATKELECLSIFGNDYNTKDGTGVRDYIHVVDLAKGHIKAIEKISKESKLDCYNLGTGTGYSVLEMVETFKKINKVDVPYKIVDRRAGDIAECYADNTYAKQELGFEPTKTLEDMVRDSYQYAINNKK
ncbi:MAG: UDP-glucose 4-epimerase GalE [Firmicutes bacterium]|nr:UDP-glucose 4-epimerase GalE [Bacillota bacterium]